MVTVLSVYSTNTAATTISTANKLMTGTGAGTTNVFSSKCGTSTGYSEVYAQGTTNNWSAAGSLGSPSGNGFLLDSTLLEGQQIVSGTWTPRFRGRVSNGTAVVDVYVRAYRYDGSTYTAIGTMTITNITLTTTSTNFDGGGNSLSAAVFPTGSKLYIDVWVDINTNSTGSSSATLSIVESISSTQGNSNSFKVDTPGYQLGGTTVTKTLQSRFLLRVQTAKTLGLRLRERVQVTRTLATRFIERTQLTRTVPFRLIEQVQLTKTLATRLRLRTQLTRTLTTRFVERVSLTRTLVLRFVERSQLTRTVPARFLLRTLRTTTLATRFVLQRLSITVTLGMRFVERSQVTRTVPVRAVLRTLRSLTLGVRFVMRSLIKTVPLRFVLRQIASKTLPIRTRLATKLTQTLGVRFVERVTATRTLALRFVERVQGPTRTLQARLRLATRLTKTLQVRFIERVTATRTLQVRFRMPSSAIVKSVQTRFRLRTGKTSTLSLRVILNVGRLTSGGFALTAAGTGTASFAAYRVTQYPDPALSLAPVLPRLGSSNVAWNALTPAGTALTVKAGTDGVNWTTVTSGGSLPGLTGQADPIIDVFTSDTSANYTNTNKSGGSTATVAYDIANSRLTLSGGSGGVYLYSALTDDEIDVICDMDISDAGGLVWRYTNSSNYYELGCYDNSATGGFTNQLRLYKVASGTRSLLGSASAITWPRATPGTSPYKRLRVTMLGAIISVYFDGILMQTYTDGSPLTSGKVGLRNDGGTSRYYQLRIQPQGDYVSGTPAGDTVTGNFVYTQVTMSTTDPSATPQLEDLTTSARSPQIATGALIEQLHDPAKPFAEFYNKELDALKESSGDYYWHVDETGALTFVQRYASPAPFCLHSSDLLNDPSVVPTGSADLYRNRQIIKNCINTVAVDNEEKIADGSASSWSMAYPLYSAPTVQVQGITKTVGLQGVDTGKDFYWQPGSPSIGQSDGAAKVPDGFLLQFSYIGQFEDTVTRDNLTEQAIRKAIEGGTGIVTAIEDGKGMLVSKATTYADSLLARFSNNDTVELVATTERPGLVAGMVLPVFIPEYQLFNEQLLIVKVTTSGYQKGDGTVVYQYELDATNGSNLANWTKALGF